MDCRTFHRNLEDYLQGGLDFAGRFGMERHAGQCLDCAKELADAQTLRRMAAELMRVKAPLDFESRVCEEIAHRRTRGFFFRLRNYWIYGFEWPSWHRIALATSCLMVLGLGAFYFAHREIRTQPPAVATVKPLPAPAEVRMPPTPPLPVQVANVAKVRMPVEESAPVEVAQIPPQPQPEVAEYFPEDDFARTEFVDYLLVGPYNRATPEKLPNKIYVRYGQSSEEHFIQNVSH